MTSSLYMCDVLLFHQCICVHFRRTLESQVKRCSAQISHHICLHRLSTAHILRSHTLAAFRTNSSRRCSYKTQERKLQAWEFLVVHRKQGLLSIWVPQKGRKETQSATPRGRNGCKQVDLEEPTQVWDQDYLRCTERVCQPEQKNFCEKRKYRFGSWNLRRPLRCCFGREKQSQEIPPGSVIWKDMRSNASNDAANSGNKHIEQFCRVSTLASTIISSSKEELEMVGDLSKVCSHVVLKMPLFWRA